MKWQIKVRKDPAPFLARVIITGKKWDANPEEAKKLLMHICEKRPTDKKVKFLMTCGGFIQFDWPESVSDVGNNKYPNKKALEELVAKAKECAIFILRDGLDKKLRKFTDYITLGIDSFMAEDNLSRPHIEFVLLVNLENYKIYWTGKSYPTSNQQKGLIRIPDLETHFLNLKDSGKIMILGCHDLKMFDPRHYKRENLCDWRKNTIKKFHERAKKERPSIVLHHPHETDCVEGAKITDRKYSPGTWDRAWRDLNKIVPTVEKYAGAGRYYKCEGERSQLSEVLEKTKSGDTIDFIV
ncbi:MAG TPA: hypothetical protein HPP66_01185 [Planctomycetes bacterium]|nr:hypothetical protein [Planctomycetota bacterium]